MFREHNNTAGIGALFAAGLLLASVPPAASQQNTAVDQAALQKGGQLYTQNCETCHQQTGTGTPPAFPALAGNAELSDLSIIVGHVHQGKGDMPAFPDLTADEIAAVATYVRNSWGNSFGGVTPDEVSTAITQLTAPQATGTTTIWSGVYSAAQAERGASILSGSCAKCHGTKLNGAGEPDQIPSPGIARSGFLQRWEGRTLGALFTYIHTEMPKDNPGQLTDQQTIDAIAEMLAVSGTPAGSAELPPDPKILSGITIKEKAD